MYNILVVTGYWLLQYASGLNYNMLVVISWCIGPLFIFLRSLSIL